MDLNKDFFIIEDFYFKEDSKKLIDYWNNNKHLCKDNKEFHSKRNLHMDDIGDEQIKYLLDYYFLKKILFIGHTFKQKLIAWQKPRICCWSEGEEMIMHVDKNKKDDMEYSCIGYLNEDYNGGKLIFNDGTEIKPKERSIIFFKSENNYHMVSRIIKGKRYTIPCWFKKYEFK
jgi:ribosomal protein S15P/S13E